MSDYQVLPRQFLLLVLVAFALARAQCPANTIYINSQCVPISCNPPYVLQNGVCVNPNATQCGNGQVYVNGGCSNIIINVYPGSGGSQSGIGWVPPNASGQRPCPNQPVAPYPPLLPTYPPTQPNQPCPNSPVTPYPPTQPNQPTPYPNSPVTPYPPMYPTPYPPTQPNQPTPCPNSPVTPYPPVHPTPYPPTEPNQPTPSPNNPVTQYPPIYPTPYPPTQPNQPTPCPNSPVTPYPPVYPTPYPPTYPDQSNPCPNSPVTPYPPPPHHTPYPPTHPDQSSPCPSSPVTPYPPVHPTPYPPTHPDQSTPCPNHPVTPYPPVHPTPYPPTHPDQSSPCPNSPVTPFPPIRPTPIPDTPEETTPTTTTSKPQEVLPPPSSPSPAPIIRCPEGTILLNGKCRLVYCSSGIYSHGHCVQTRCPPGTIWTGQRCDRPKPVELGPIHLEKTIINPKPDTEANVVFNNVNNLVVNASIALTPGAAIDYDEEEEDEEIKEKESTSIAPSTGKCCHVIAPRICRGQVESVKWKCFSRTQQQCGDFCSASKVVLKPSNVTQWFDGDDEMLIMPPNWVNPCKKQGNCDQIKDHHDCSGCAAGLVATCSSYCYTYRCSSHNCAFYDQRQYCQQYAGQVGCRKEDGWFQ